MSDFSVPTAMLGAAMGAAMLACALAYLGRRPGASPALRWWAAGFVCNFLRHLVGIVGGQPAPALAGFLGDALLAAFVALLCGGTMLFLDRRPLRGWLLAGFASAVGWAWFTSFVVPDFLLRGIPIYALTGAAMMGVGCAFWRKRHEPEGTEYAAVAIAFFLQGLHALDYPFLGNVAGVAPFGFLLAQALWMAIALGLIIVALRRQDTTVTELNRAALEAQSRLSEVEAEARAERAQARLASAIDGLSDGLAIFDANDELVISNAAHRRMLGPAGRYAVPGVRFEELVRKVLASDRLDLDPGERSAWLERRLAQHRDPKRAIDVRLDTGQWIQIREHSLADGGIAVIMTDVSDAKEHERQLAEKTSLLQATLDSMGEGISVFDRNHRLVAWNDRALELLNLPPELYRMGTPLADFVRFQARRGELSSMTSATPAAPISDEAVGAEIECYLQQMRENPFRRSARWRSSGRYVEQRRNPMPDGGFVNVFSDMTDRQKVEDALRQAKEAAEFANRTKTEFLANMSHELRTPLNAVIGFAEILEQELLGPLGTGRYCEYARDIRDSGTHLLTLINDILDVSKAEAGRIELSETILRIDSVINASLTLINERAREAELTLTSPKTDHLPALRADERRLKQVLINLLSNAVKFTPAGGTVSIDVEADAVAGFKIRVADTGIGMAADEIPRALEPFGQIDSALARKYEGTGLGLPLSKALVELHGGQLAIESEVGVGTVVTIALPPDRLVAKSA